jgi:hypothetical protein
VPNAGFNEADEKSYGILSNFIQIFLEKTKEAAF